MLQMLLRFIILVALENIAFAVDCREVDEKLAALRTLFYDSKVINGSNVPLAAYVLPRSDAHQSEYISAADGRVQFLSGFSGSNAYVIVSTNKAVLWTDGRYTERAKKQLDSRLWELIIRGYNSVTPEEWLISNLKTGDRVGFDPALFSFDSGSKFFDKMRQVGISFVPIETNLVNLIWKDRPSHSKKPVRLIPEQLSGQSVKNKIEEMRKAARKKACSAVVFGALDDVMYLTNLRGNDIPYCPVAFSYMFITPSQALLFIDPDQIEGNQQAKDYLISQGIDIFPYNNATEIIRKLHEAEKDTKDYRVFVPTSVNYAVGSIFGDRAIFGVSPAEIMKAVKNKAELAASRSGHTRDSAALVEFLRWFEEGVKTGKTYTEIELAEKVESIRAQKKDFLDQSFDTISAIGDHAALPHYSFELREGNRTSSPETVYLLDSGGHYLDGSTDVTRTVLIDADPLKNGKFMLHNTLVLKGHIALAMTKFPKGISGGRLDGFARHALWQKGLDYGHGTGHGVGYNLFVHEGPYFANGGYGVNAGNIITIEPGFYKPGEYGIRIENCYETRDSAALVEFLRWFEEGVKTGKTYTEIELAEKVESIRAQKKDFLDQSFDTISAIGDHAALPHYSFELREGNRTSSPETVYLLDSGGHYLDGSTDVTRTVLIDADPLKNGKFMLHNTLVLKGHIALAMTKFPKGISGGRLDGFARHALWQKGLDYGHGTGHGVGYNLFVHEGPCE